MKAGTHSPSPTGSHTTAHTPKQGAFRMGVVSLLSECSARSPTSPGQVSERQTLPLWGLGQGYSRRTQKAFGTAMRLCVSLARRRRGPAGLRDLFTFVEMPDGRLSKRLIGRFLGLTGSSLIPAAQNVPRFFWNSSISRQTAPVPCERNRGCFFVTSCSDTGRLRSGRGCRWRWDRTCRRPRRR